MDVRKDRNEVRYVFPSTGTLGSFINMDKL